MWLQICNRVLAIWFFMWFCYYHFFACLMSANFNHVRVLISLCPPICNRVPPIWFHLFIFCVHTTFFVLHMWQLSTSWSANFLNLPCQCNKAVCIADTPLIVALRAHRRKCVKLLIKVVYIVCATNWKLCQSYLEASAIFSV